MTIMDMLNECLYECMTFPLCLIDNCICDDKCSCVHVSTSIRLLQHSVLAFLCMYMSMGLLARVFEACSHVLFIGRRHGDMTLCLCHASCGVNILSCDVF